MRYFDQKTTMTIKHDGGKLHTMDNQGDISGTTTKGIEAGEYDVVIKKVNKTFATDIMKDRALMKFNGGYQRNGIDNERAIATMKLSGIEYAIYLYLKTRIVYEDNRILTNNHKTIRAAIICKELKCSPKTAQKALLTLENRGIIKKGIDGWYFNPHIAMKGRYVMYTTLELFKGFEILNPNQETENYNFKDGILL